MDSAFIVCRALHFAAAMLVFGASLFPLYAAAGETDALAPLDATLRPLLTAAAGVALLAAVAMVPCVAGLMAGSAAAAFDAPTLATVLLQTSFGRIWRWHLLIAAWLVVACGAWPTRPAWRALPAGLQLASLALVGHAAANPAALGIGEACNDALHLLAGGVRLGALPPLMLLARRARPAGGDAQLALLREALPRFSMMAYGAVAAVLLTGFVNSVLLLGSIGALAGTQYGRVLALKLSLFLLLLAVAVVNRLVLTPRVAARQLPSQGAAALAWTIALEQALALAIIAAVAVLGTLPPGAHMHTH